MAAKRIAKRWSARAVHLTDSGSSALAGALHLALPMGDDVAMPAWGCPDLLAAARAAGVRVRFYDVDPHNLSPDLASLEAAIGRGARAIVLVHFFGIPADAAAVRTIADRHEAVLVEDCAQAAWAEHADRPVGSHGSLVVLSFGRGKGINAGGGGALIAREAPFAEAMSRYTATSAPPVGWRALAVTAALWTLARPSLYWLPSSIPWLRLGEMRYHDTHLPEPMPAAAVSLLGAALDAAPIAGAARAAKAERLRTALEAAGIPQMAAPSGSRATWLRLPVVLPTGELPGDAAALGVLRPYPVPLDAVAEGRDALAPGESAGAGARRLAASLVTLPTHDFVTARDERRLIECLRSTFR